MKIPIGSHFHELTQDAEKPKGGDKRHLSCDWRKIACITNPFPKNFAELWTLMNENEMDSFLYLRDSGFDGDNQAVDSQDQEQQPVVYMDDQRQSWPNHDALNTIQDHHDVTHFLLPMENEEWSILHENQLLTDQTMFQDGKSTSMDMAPEANSVPPGPNSSVDNISDAHYVTPDMIYQGNTEAVSGREAPKPTEQSIPNESTRMSTRSRTKKVDAAPNEDGTKMQKESEETAERKRKGQKTKKLYCICQQPYDGNPMVQCDNCQEW